ncbi:MAG: hypothetical protein WA765_18855 [Candidatus Acidiferrum sp.]
MKSYKAFLFLILVPCLSLTSCYHEFAGGGGGGGVGGGGGGGGATTANVSLTMVSDTLPANIGIISFRVSISSIVLTSSTGTTSTLNTGNLIVDLARAQSDSIYLGTIAGVPTGTNSSISVQLTGGEIAFYNGTGAALTSPVCPAGAICVAPFNANGVPVITSSLPITANTGFGIDFNLANALTVTGTTLNINLTNSGTANVLSSFALPRNTDLAAGQLDLIEDFTGVATVTGTSVSVVSQPAAGRGTITASSSSNTVYDQDPTQTLCPTGTATLSGCITTTNEAASMDAILNSDGTFTVQEIEPLLSSPILDTVEGTVFSIDPNLQTQFEMVVSDIIPATTSSKIGSLSMGDPLTVNLGTGPAFWVDSKGLPMLNSAPASYDTFFNQTNTTALHLGQVVAVHVNSFTAANGTTPAIANSVDTVTLRWSRFIAPVAAGSSPGLFDTSGLPGYFNLNPATIAGVQVFLGTQGQDGVTNLDGIANSSTPAATPSLGVRALYLEDTGFTLNPPFFAAKVRQH